MKQIFKTADAYESHFGIEGEFEYLKQFTLDDAYPLPDGTRKPVPKRLSRVLEKNDITSLYDLRHRTIGEIWQLKDFGHTCAEQLNEWMKARHGIILDHSSAIKNHHYIASQKAVQDIRSYADLQQDLPAYAEVGQMAAEHDRHKPGSVVPVQKHQESQAEKDFRDNFIHDTIMRRIKKDNKKNLDIPLLSIAKPQDADSEHISFLCSLSGRENDQGQTLETVGDVVMAGSTGLITEFHVARKWISRLEVELHPYGLSFDLFRKAQADYHAMIGDLTKQVTTPAKRQRRMGRIPDHDR